MIWFFVALFCVLEKIPGLITYSFCYRQVERKNQSFSNSNQTAKTGNDNGKNRLEYSILQKSEFFPLFAMAMSAICRNFGAKSLLI